MNTLEQIDEVEAKYSGQEGIPSLGLAFKMLRSRWQAGLRDRETTVRLMFLAWYCYAEPTFLTGLPDNESTSALLLETFESLGGTSSMDAEVCFVVGLMAQLFGIAFGEQSKWIATGAELKARAGCLNPKGFSPEYFEGRGAYGDYFSHMARIAVFKH